MIGWDALFAPCAGMLGAVCAHLVGCRLGLGLMRAYGLSLLAGAAATAAALYPAVPSWSLGVALELYLAWWFVFLNLAQAMESSLRVQVLRELASGGEAITLGELLTRYNDRALTRLRLERMIQGGGVARRDGRLHVESALLRGLARFFLALKIVLLGRRSEFDGGTGLQGSGEGSSPP